MAFRDFFFLVVVVVKLFFSPIDISFNAEFSNSFKGEPSNMPERTGLSRVSGSQQGERVSAGWVGLSRVGGSQQGEWVSAG